MTFHSGMRRRKVPVLPSTPQGQTRATDGPASPLVGGTGARSLEELRVDMDVPTLSLANRWTGLNTFEDGGGIDTEGLTVRGTAIQAGQGIVATGDQSTFTGAYVAALVVDALYAQYVEKTANYTLDDGDQDFIVNVTANSPTVTLFSAVGTAGRIIIIKNSGAGTVTLATTSSQTIDGAAPGTVASGGVIRLVSTGSNWISV